MKQDMQTTGHTRGHIAHTYESFNCLQPENVSFKLFQH